LATIWKRWVGAVRKVYNISIAYLNEHQGFTRIGKKGGKHGFRTMLKASGLIPAWCTELGVSKLLDNASMEAFTAWSETARTPKFIGKGKDKKPNPQAGKKIARFRSVRDARITLQFDPTGYNNGRWMVSATRHLPASEFKGHNFCIITDRATELTYAKGRWEAHFVVDAFFEVTRSDRVIALDPGVRTFLTGFNGNEFLEFGEGDFQRIARLSVHLDALKSRHDKAIGRSGKRLRYKLRVAMRQVRTRIKNLRSECHKQVASNLARNYDVIVLPTFETSQMVVKTSRKLHSKTARAMMSWAFYQFSQTLQHLCNRYGSKLVRITEEYTSKTCTKCGHVHRKLGSSKIFRCPECSYEIPRDFNGALGIFLKAVWDTTLFSVNDAGHVVLDF
jgi:putative transposase